MMKILFGLTGRLAFAFIALAIAVQWINYQTSSGLRSAALQQREVDKINAVSRVIVPEFTQEGEQLGLIVKLVLMQDGLASGMLRQGPERSAAIAKILDYTYQESKVDVLQVTDDAGVVLYRAHEPGRSGDLATAWGVAEALAGKGSIVSTKGAGGPSILAIEPIWAGGKIIGTISAGNRIGDRFLRSLSTQLGAELALLNRSGDLVASSAPGKIRPDALAVTEAFQQKIPIYRTHAATHTSLVYLPVLIVDDSWVIVTQIDSTSVFDLLEKGNQQSALVTLLVVGGSVLITFLVLRFVLKPLRQLRSRAEKIVFELTGNANTMPASDDIVSIVKILGTLTDLLLSRNRELAEQRAEIELEASQNQVTATEKIKKLAFYDPLTSLPNRRLLLILLERTLAASSRHQRNGALLFIDLDNFKVLNDTLGHDKGDLLLQQVAQRLSACIREGDTVARLGGDEFVVMLKDLSENPQEAAKDAKTVGENILVALNQIYQLAGYEHNCSASIGVTLFADRHGTIDDLLKQADLAMYQAKAAGRNSLRFFDPEMQAQIMARAVMESDLREAILKDEFHLYYQVQVAGERRLTGAEALVRWEHPQRGIVLPAEFIPLAEETGMILALGNWVLESACTQLAIWATRPEMAHLTVAVNVSARQLHHSDFVNQVLAVLERTGAKPHRLKLELTESLLISNVEDVIAKMTALKARGVGFSMDDFGTGYSSLSYLKRLPLDQLKIDQSFVRDILIDPNDAAIAKMIVALADSLGLAVIAEGVETEAQRDCLALMGCHTHQGYLFSRPLPLAEFEEYVKRGGANPKEASSDAFSVTA
jgi:diguanylate cyclase (GGDEF)-like protein